jgi:MinD superfamily P-loop ATPase
VKEIVVISGKGGTGKTSLVASFAALADNAVLADCDVDAADLHLLLAPRARQSHDFSGGKLARIDPARCVGCGRCHEVCQFEAVTLDGPANAAIAKTYAIDSVACEGCGVCAHFCPADAIEFRDAVNGQWFVSDTRFGPMIHARLKPAEENSGKLVTLIRKEAQRIAGAQGRETIIVDGSPGIGCPVIASITGANLVLVVTEPTMSGEHDLDRVVELTRHFGIPALVCINKWDINPAMTQRIERAVYESGLKVAGRVTYDASVTKAQVAGRSVVESCGETLRDQIVALWETVHQELVSVTSAKETA